MKKLIFNSIVPLTVIGFFFCFLPSQAKAGEALGCGCIPIENPSVFDSSCNDAGILAGFNGGRLRTPRLGDALTLPSWDPGAGREPGACTNYVNGIPSCISSMAEGAFEPMICETKGNN